jgi:NADH-quinone oxidoreductase subunit H
VNGWVLAGSALLALSFMLVNVMVTLYIERKSIGHMQMRLGPMRTGWHGLMQSPADVLKLLTKEDIVPAKADKFLFALAPAIVLGAAYTIMATVPWAPGVVPREMSIGAFFVLAVASLMPVGFVIGGWSSANKYSLIGGLRAAAQQISYEVPLLMSMIAVVMLTGSLRLSDIVAYQVRHGWNIYGMGGIGFIGFFIFMVAATAEMNRIPFDFPESESELIGGYATEYSGMRWGLFNVAEYNVLLVLSAVSSLIFLGGWDLFGLPVPPLLVMLAKTYGLIFVYIWMRASLPRPRVDQLMSFCWKFLLPLGLVNILLAGLWMYATGAI